MIGGPPPWILYCSVLERSAGVDRMGALCALVWEDPHLTKEGPGSCCCFLDLDNLPLSLARAQSTEKQGYAWQPPQFVNVLETWKTDYNCSVNNDSISLEIVETFYFNLCTPQCIILSLAIILLYLSLANLPLKG